VFKGCLLLMYTPTQDVCLGLWLRERAMRLSRVAHFDAVSGLLDCIV
jgi:hypothetical protein